MGERSFAPFGVGSMWATGDLTGAPEGTVPLVSNFIYRAGPRIEPRQGYVQETAEEHKIDTLAVYAPGDKQIKHLYAVGVPTQSGLYKRGSLSGIRLALAADRANHGPWAAATGFAGYIGGGGDYANGFKKMYGLFRGDKDYGGANDGGAYQVNEDLTVTRNPFDIVITGRTIHFAYQRLFIGGPKLVYANLAGANNVAWKFEDNTVWTPAAGMTVNAVVNNVRSVNLTNGTTDTLTSAWFVAAGADRWITWVQCLRAKDAEKTAFLTLSIVDSATNIAIASTPFELPSATDEPDWVLCPVRAKVKSGVGFYLRIDAGTVSRAASPLVTFDLADTTNNDKGCSVTVGRFAYDDLSTLAASKVLDYPHRLIWCEVDEPEHWRGQNYWDMIEEQGEITAVRSGRGRIVVYKRDAIWLFAPTEDPDIAVIKTEGPLRGVGCLNWKSIVSYNDTHFFIGERNVYKWDLQGLPEPLAHEGVREMMFPANVTLNDPASRDATACIGLDENEEELWVYPNGSAGSGWVYNIRGGGWSLAVRSGVAGINSATYARANGDSEDRMWFTATEYWEPPVGDPNPAVWLGYIGGMSHGDGDYSIEDGKNGYFLIESTYDLRPIQSSSPLLDITVEGVLLFHASVAAQGPGGDTSSSVEIQWSRDEGKTWNFRRFYLSGEGISVRSKDMLPVWETSSAIRLRLKRSGKALAGGFYFYGGQLALQMNGEVTLATAPTFVAEG